MRMSQTVVSKPGQGSEHHLDAEIVRIALFRSLTHGRYSHSLIMATYLK